jgi:hypothetical protein
MTLYKIVTKRATLCLSPDLETVVSIEYLTFGKPSLSLLQNVVSAFSVYSRNVNYHDIFQLLESGRTLVYRHTSGNIDWIIDIEREEYKILNRQLKINSILN